MKMHNKGRKSLTLSFWGKWANWRDFESNYAQLQPSNLALPVNFLPFSFSSDFINDVWSAHPEPTVTITTCDEFVESQRLRFLRLFFHPYPISRPYMQNRTTKDRHIARKSTAATTLDFTIARFTQTHKSRLQIFRRASRLSSKPWNRWVNSLAYAHASAFLLFRSACNSMHFC